MSYGKKSGFTQFRTHTCNVINDIKRNTKKSYLKLLS